FSFSFFGFSLFPFLSCSSSNSLLTSVVPHGAGHRTAVVFVLYATAHSKMSQR
uniref:Uncharacterized protein n=1 Tax=Anser brachyrhynchus TaxID=132585 RepID=A0A8B9BE14_9AVES